MVRNAKLFFLNCETNRDVFFVRLLVTSRNICDLWRKTRNETPIYSMLSVALQLLYLLPTGMWKRVSSYRTAVNHPVGRECSIRNLAQKHTSNTCQIINPRYFLGVMNLPAYRDIPAYLASTWGPLGPPPTSGCLARLRHKSLLRASSSSFGRPFAESQLDSSARHFAAVSTSWRILPS